MDLRPPMKNPYLLIPVTFLCLAILALYLVPEAFHRGDRAGSFILLVIAMIFFKRVQSRRS